MELKDAQTFNAAAFILHNHIVNENGNPIEFADHKFLSQPYMDNTPKQVVRKAGQVGWSTLAVIRAIHLAKYAKANVIYTLPSKSVVKDFVLPKVNPLIASNPKIKEMVGETNSTALKAIGDRFVYFRGSWEEGSAISISAHILINDEVDRSNQKVLETYKTRLDAAKMDRPELGWEWKFSNPSRPGDGVDVWWEQSDQKHWFIKCSHCNLRQYMEWPLSVDFDREVFICKKCNKELSKTDRNNGHWVKKYFGRDISGYWINQMMVPWHSAKKLIEDSHGDQQVFHNFMLGMPYQTKDQSMSRADLVKCLIPTTNPRTNVAIGVDNGIIKHYVVGNQYGIFRIGQTESVDEIEDLRNQYNAVMVIDEMPYPTWVRKLVNKYRGKVFAHNYKQDINNIGTIQWGESDNFGRVWSDRTKIIDGVVADILAQDLIFNMSQTDLENADYIYHWLQMFRTTEESERGIKRATWKHPEGRPDHYPHATVYFKVAMQKTLSHGAVVRPLTPSQREDISPVILPGNKIPAFDLQASLERANKPRNRDWRLR